MRCVAVIEAQRPGLDTVILWDDSTRLLAYAYEGGRVTMTRVLDASTLNNAIRETQEAFQINQAQLTRIHNWESQTAQTEKIGTLPDRWN